MADTITHTPVLSYVQTHRQRFMGELFDLLRIPSISTDPAYKAQVRSCAYFLADKLKESGAEKVEVCDTAGHPIIYAEKIIDPTLPTVLVYGHYDVQPADPLDLWHSPPFDPQIRQERIYARGSADDKGQMYMHVKAFETMMRTGTLACNVKFMIEGEEECGSSSLRPFLQANKDRLKADIILVSDTDMIANDIPSICVGLRGLSYLEVEVTGPNRDLHSGIYGGAVPNPINTLCDIISRLKDADGHITIPGFYDGVLEVSAGERSQFAQIPFNLQEFKEHIGIRDIVGEKSYSTIERTSIRPTLDVNGIWGGYTGQGAKTIIPSKAHAKISMRLVPGQDPHRITQLFTEYIHQLAPPSVHVHVHPHHGGDPILLPTDSVAYRACARAYADTFGREPVAARGGGSIPIIAMFKQELGLDSVMMGFGLPTDAIHSPNESYGVFNYFKGIETIPLFYQYYAQMYREAGR